MGRKAAKSRTSNNRKKSQPQLSSTSSGPQDPFQILLKYSPQNKKTLDFMTSLQKSLKNLTLTFRSRINLSDIPYETGIFTLASEKFEKFDEVLSSLIMELTEYLLNSFKSSQSLPLFLLESYKCIQSAGQILSPLSESGGVLQISKLSYFYTILKPAFENQTSLKYSPELKSLYNDLLNFCSSFKDHNLLPLEKLVQLFHGTRSSKAFAKACSDISTDDSCSSIESIDSEVEEFSVRLENCEKVLNRNKPQVSQEWISYLRKQINQNH